MSTQAKPTPGPWRSEAGWIKAGRHRQEAIPGAVYSNELAPEVPAQRDALKAGW